MFAVQYSRFGPADDVLHVGPALEPHAGPSEVRIAVRAAGVTPADARLRAGKMPLSAPLTWPHIPGVDAAGTVNEVGSGVEGVDVGDEVFGAVDVTRLGGASAEFAVLQFWAPRPAELDVVGAGGAATSIETATRTLDALGVIEGMTLLVDGAAGGVGNVVVQLAVARGATVLGTASTANHDLLAELGAKPVRYGPGLADRVGALAPGGVDAALDVAGAGSLTTLIALTGSADRVVTIADFTAAQHAVRLSHSGPGGGPDGRHGLAVAAELAAKGRFHIPLRAVLPFERAAEAHNLTETGHARGKTVLTVP